MSGEHAFKSRGAILVAAALATALLVPALGAIYLGWFYAVLFLVGYPLHNAKYRTVNRARHVGSSTETSSAVARGRSIGLSSLQHERQSSLGEPSS